MNVNLDSTVFVGYNGVIMLQTQDQKDVEQLRYMRAVLSERQSEAGRSDREREECKKTVKALDRAVELFNTQYYA